MPDFDIENTPPLETEAEPQKDMSRREALKVIATFGLAATIWGVNPTKQQISAAYSYLSKEREEGMENYVDPVDSYPHGEWKFYGGKEEVYKIETINHPFEIPVGDYMYSSGPNKILLHLGSHGQIGDHYTNTSPKIENPSDIGAISIDSLHPFTAWQNAGSYNKEARYSPYNLGNVPSEMVDQENKWLEYTLSKWVQQNPDGDTVFLATDLPGNDVIISDILFSGAPWLPNNVINSIDPLIKSAEFISATAVATTAAEMIQKLLTKRDMTRRDFLKLPLRVGKIGAASVATLMVLQPAFDFFKANIQYFNNIEVGLRRERIDLKVKKREPEDFLGRIEALINKDNSKIGIWEVFVTLRDLTSTYKELCMIEEGHYRTTSKHNLLCCWGAFHDTKLGLYSAKRDHLLDLMTRFNKKFANEVNMLFAVNNEDQFLQTKIQKDALWTSMAYKTTSDSGKRKIASAEVWYFPELEEIFNNKINTYEV